MKIVIIGGTGLIGSKLVTRLRELGHEAVAASPNTGVNTLTGEGLTQVLAGADVVVDVSNSPSFEDAAVLLRVAVDRPLERVLGRLAIALAWRLGSRCRGRRGGRRLLLELDPRVEDVAGRADPFEVGVGAAGGQEQHGERRDEEQPRASEHRLIVETSAWTARPSG